MSAMSNQRYLSVVSVLPNTPVKLVILITFSTYFSPFYINFSQILILILVLDPT